jgi:glyoxylase I family protein
MINFRVDDAKGFAVALEASGTNVVLLPDETYGIFAHLEDPEGNPIELWQPPVGE